MHWTISTWASFLFFFHGDLFLFFFDFNNNCYSVGTAHIIAVDASSPGMCALTNGHYNSLSLDNPWHTLSASFSSFVLRLLSRVSYMFDFFSSSWWLSSCCATMMTFLHVPHSNLNTLYCLHVMLPFVCLPYMGSLSISIVAICDFLALQNCYRKKKKTTRSETSLPRQSSLQKIAGVRSQLRSKPSSKGTSSENFLATGDFFERASERARLFEEELEFYRTHTLCALSTDCTVAIL